MSCQCQCHYSSEVITIGIRCVTYSYSRIYTDMAMADTFVRNLLNYFQLIFGVFFIISFLLYFGIIFDNDYEARLSIPKPQLRRISKTGRLKNVDDSTHSMYIQYYNYINHNNIIKYRIIYSYLLYFKHF